MSGGIEKLVGGLARRGEMRLGRWTGGFCLMEIFDS